MNKKDMSIIFWQNNLYNTQETVFLIFSNNKKKEN